MTKYFIDANIFIYAFGAESKWKEPCKRVLTSVAERKLDAVINSEVLQELLYRYSRMGKGIDGTKVVWGIRSMPLEVLPVTVDDALLCARIFEETRFSADVRDALHVATMRNNGVSSIVTFDSDFDKFEGIEVVLPEDLPTH